MAKMKLKQLRDADVRYISLVDRAATRIPFRVLKRDKEHKMGIDLTKVFKSENAEKPYVSALVVFAQKDETVGTAVTDAIKAHGFKTDRVQKSDEGETLVYAQTDQPKDVHIVRLSDQVLMNVANLQIPNGWVGEMVTEQGFFPDLKTTSAALYEKLVEVSKSETPQPEAEAVLTSYAEYLNQVLVLPASAFKLDEKVTTLVKKEDKDDEDEEDQEDDVEDETDEDTPAVEAESEGDGTALKGETEAEKKKRAKKHPPAEMEPKDEDDDQKPPPSAVKKETVEKKPEKKVVAKCDPENTAILTALKGIEATVKGLSTKLDTVVAEQATTKKVLDDVVQKTDTLGDTLKTTVTAPPVSEDRPSSARMRVQKDDDPRTGTFDTAFLRRRR